MKCPNCDSVVTSRFLRRHHIPVHQNLLIKDRGSAKRVPRGDLELMVCDSCGFIFNAAFDPERLNYDSDYDNVQTHSPFFNAYIDELVRSLVEEKGVHNCRVVEVGCGKGYFLRRVVEADGSGNTGYGFDPSYEGPEIDLGGRIRFKRCTYGPESAGVSADVVICRHVIEHISHPIHLLRNIRESLIGSDRARVFCETPCAEWILRHGVFWDFYYEHCSYFTVPSLTLAFERAGFDVDSVEHVFGGQYLWLEARVGRVRPTIAPRGAEDLMGLCEEFSKAESRLVGNWRTRLRDVRRKGSIALWGAGAKGVTLANQVDSQEELIACVVDLNPRKQGCFVAGSGHPIVGYLDLPKYMVSSVVLTNPNYREEIVSILRRSKMNVSVIEPGDWRAVN